VLVANHSDGLDFHHASEHLCSNIRTVRVVTEIFSQHFFEPVRSRKARLDRHLRNGESPNRIPVLSDWRRVLAQVTFCIPDVVPPIPEEAGQHVLNVQSDQQLFLVQAGKASRMAPIKSCLNGSSRFLLKSEPAGQQQISGQEHFLENCFSGLGEEHQIRDKGCDIGYALAASSCEGAHSVEHAPSQPFDAITAFAVPNPNLSSQSRRFFQVWSPSRSPCPADHPIYFGLANFI
jgi:hypothetical protein